MNRPVLLFGRPDSSLAPGIAARLQASGLAAHVLAIDAPLDGEPVTVRDDAVTWQGHDLRAAAALWCEDPVFPWPQPLPPPCELPDAANFARWRRYQREARSLAVSALAIACETVPALNPPIAAHLALAPTVLLDALAAAGVPVHPWRVAAGDPEPGEAAGDATGTDRWHRPGPAPAGAPRLLHAPLGGAVEAVLLVDGAAVVAGAWPSLAAWAAGGPAAPADAAGATLETARAAARALALPLALVACGDGRVLRVDAAPDLAEWDAMTADGAVAAAIARKLAAMAAAR